MKHVMTPVRLSDWLNALIMDATGDDILQVRAGRTAKDRSLEIVQAINEYDELVAQRDALVGACEQLMAWIGPPLTDRASYDSAREVAWSAARDALALVRGEDV